MIETTAIRLQNNEPLMVTWDILRRCNLDCTYCESTRHDITSTLPSLEELKSTFDFIHKYVGLYNSKRTIKSITNIDFTGGEPTINPAFWQLIEYIKSHNHYRLSLTTNGTWGPAFTQRIVDNFNHVTVSWHSEADVYLKTRTVNNIIELKNLGVTVQANVMLHCDNFAEAIEVCNSLKDNGIKINPVPIGDGAISRKGWFIDADGTNRRTSHEYTTEQQEWFFNFMGLKKSANSVQEGTHIGRACCGGRCTQGLVEGNWQDVKLVNNWFKDWYCTVNWYFLHIEQNTGNVFHHQTCQATHTGRGPIGNLSNKDLILENTRKLLSQETITPIICPNQRCGCGMCVPKAKEFDNFKELWTATTVIPIKLV